MGEGLRFEKKRNQEYGDGKGDDAHRVVLLGAFEKTLGFGFFRLRLGHQLHHPGEGGIVGALGDAQFDAVLDSGAWHNNGSDAVRPMTLRIGNLIVGQTYLVSLFSADARTTDRNQAYWDTFSAGTFSGGTSGSFSQNPGTMTMFTFTADAAFQDVFIQETDNIGNDDTNLAAFTLYAVPEPSSAVLVGGMGLLALLRRRRS